MKLMINSTKNLKQFFSESILNIKKNSDILKYQKRIGSLKMLELGQFGKELLSKKL